MTIALLSAAGSIHTIRWANAFVERGHAVHLISQHEPATGLDARVRVHRLPHLKGLGYLLNGWRLSRLLARIGPDVVNAHYATGYGRLARSVGAFPLVINVWGSDVLEFPGKGPFHSLWLVKNLERAQALVSTSFYMSEHTKALATDLPPIYVVPFGVDTDLFSPAEAKDQRDTLVIGTVKVLAPIYGIDILIKAFAMLVRAGKYKLRLRIVGGGPQLEELQGLARTLAVADYVDFIGPLPHSRVPEELRAMDIYAALSRSESFGVAVIEASACGLPVVVSDVGGLPEVVEDGTTGFVVPAENAQAAAAKLEELLASAELRHRIGTAGRAHVQDRYQWSHCVDRQLDVFEKVIKERLRH
jgi:glycosyltransferase involved in cell wall biosynthesis